MDRRSLWAALAMGMTVFGADPASSETLEQRVERMEKELKEVKTELRRRDEAERRAARKPPTTESAPPAARPSSNAATTVESPPPAEPAKQPESRVAKADAGESGMLPRSLRALTDRVKLGGYGSFRFEANNNPADNDTFTYRRFVLTGDANIAPRLRAYAEVELERFRELEVEKSLQPADGGLLATQTVEATNNSEISLEQAWLQYDIEPWLNFRGGAVLVPLGRFNLNHDDDRWDIPRRSLVDRGVPVLPSTSAWDELGIGFLGDIPLSDDVLLSYQTYVVNGAALDFEFEQLAQTRFPDTPINAIEVEVSPSTGTFDTDVKNAKSFTGRVALSPALGHEIGASWYFGRYTPSFLPDEKLWSLAGDFKSVFGSLELEGEYVFTHFGGIRNVATGLARVAREQESEFENPSLETEVEFELANLATSKQGYWLDLRYRFWPSFLSKSFLAWELEDPKLVAVLRGEQVWLNGLVTETTFGGGRLVSFETQNRRVDRVTVALAYRPVPLVVFSLAYEYTHTNPGQSLSSVTNFIPGNTDHQSAFLFGAAFGF
jgi:hypothetical protein